MNTLRIEIFILLLPLLLLCVPREGFAQGDTATAVSEADAALARKYLDDGVEAYRSNDFEAARDKFRRSFNLKRSYDTAINLGNVEEKLKLYRDAAEHLDYGLRHYPTAQNQHRKKKIEQIFERVRPHVGAVAVVVDIPGASLFVDDRPVGTSPLEYELFVEEGTHEVRAEFEGEVVSTEFAVKMGETSAVSLKFEERSSTSSSGLDEGEPTLGEAPPGEVEANRAKRNWIPAWILGGATFATLGTSMVFRSLSAGSTREMDDLGAGLSESDCTGGGGPEECAELNSTGRRANTQATVADATLIGGGVLGAATIGYIVYTLVGAGKSSRIQATASPEPGGAFLSLSGRF